MEQKEVKKVIKYSKRITILKQEKSEIEIKSLTEVIELLKKQSRVKFTETINLDIKLGINPKKSDESIRTSLSLPHGLGSKKRIAIFTTSDNFQAAKDAGADGVFDEMFLDTLKKEEKDFNYDICITTPGFFNKLLSVAKILGKRGLMPNIKDGTVTDKFVDLIKELKSGSKINLRNDSTGHLRLKIGTIKFSTQFISENIKAIFNYLSRNKPAKVKEMIMNIYLNTTMGIGYKISKQMLNS